LEEVQQLSPRETTVLKHIASHGQKQDRTISFSMKNVCKDLELDDLEFLDTLVSLSFKGFIKILRLPCSEELQDELRKRFLQVDMLSTVFGGQSNEKDQVVRILGTLEASGPKWADTTSLQELVSYSFDLDQAMQQMNENLQSLDYGQGTQGEQLPSARSNERKLLGLQRKLDRCLQRFWEGVNLLREGSPDIEGGTPRIVRVEGLSTVAKKETRPMRPGQEKTARMIALLLAVRADAVTRSAAPIELAEELEELEARALIGEITPEFLSVKKKEFEQRIEQSRLAIISISGIERLAERLLRRIELANALGSAGSISKKLQAKITESATSDLEQVEKAFPRQLTDFCVSRSGEFLAYLRSS